MEPSVEFIVRRPIYDASLSTVGYDLLLETAGDSDDAIRLIVEGLAGFELPELINDAAGFVSVSASLLTAPNLTQMPGIGFDLRPDLAIDGQVADGIRLCASLGIPVLVHDEHRAAIEEHDLIRKVTWSRVNAAERDAECLRMSIDAWTRLGIPTVVDGVGSRVQQQIARRMGVEWFSGSFVSEPPVRMVRMSPSRVGVLRLLTALYAPESSLTDIAALVENEPAVGYRLLRLLNSAHYGLSRAVSSIKEAVILLGPQQIASWVSLIAMAGIDDVPSESMTTAVIRGRMCEQLARAAGESMTSTYFLAGVLSALDRILHMPLDDIIHGLPLDERIVAGVLQRDGSLGAALTVVTAYEEARWDDVRKFRWSADQVRQSYVEAVGWAGTFQRQLAA